MNRIVVLLLLCALLCGCSAAGSNPVATVPSTLNMETMAPTTVPEATVPSGTIHKGPGLTVDPYDPENKVPEITKNQIRQDFCKVNPAISPDDVRLRFMGYFKDAYVLFVDVKDMMYAEVITTEKVAGFTFVYSCSQHMLVWHEGQFYSLKLAYDNGILTKEDLRTLVKDYYAAYPNLWQYVAVPE